MDYQLSSISRTQTMLLDSWVETIAGIFARVSTILTIAAGVAMVTLLVLVRDPHLDHDDDQELCCFFSLGIHLVLPS